MDPQDEICPVCNAQPGESCDMVNFPVNPPRDFHHEREVLAEAADSAKE